MVEQQKDGDKFQKIKYLKIITPLSNLYLKDKDVHFRQ